MLVLEGVSLVLDVFSGMIVVPVWSCDLWAGTGVLWVEVEVIRVVKRESSSKILHRRGAGIR